MSTVQVLLAEDNPDDAYLVMRALKQQGLDPSEIHWAQDGEEVLEYLRKGHESLHGLRLVLLDLKMPKLTGLEVLEQLRSEPHTRHLPVVIWSSSREDQDVKASYDLGTNSYVVKPIDYKEFVSTVTAVSHYWLHLNLPPQNVSYT